MDSGVNRDKRSEFKVTKAVAFRDFLIGRAQVQTADVGVELSRRDLSGNPDEMEAKRREFMNSLRRKVDFSASRLIDRGWAISHTAA